MKQKMEIQHLVKGNEYILNLHYPKNIYNS